MLFPQERLFGPVFHKSPVLHIPHRWTEYACHCHYASTGQVQELLYRCNTSG